MMTDEAALDALFADAFALLEADLPSRQRSKRIHEGSTARRKRLLDALRMQETSLRHQLERLVGPSDLHVVREQALSERVKRHRAELERQALRDAVYQHTEFLRGLQSVFAGGLQLPLNVRVYHHLHDFTRLPRDARIRQHEYAILRRDERFRTAIDLICRETERLPTNECLIETNCEHPDHDPITVVTRTVQIMHNCDVPTALRAVSVAVQEIVVGCCDWASMASEIVDAEASGDINLQYCLANLRRQSDLDTSELSVEARTVVMYKMMGDAAVVFWDHVDEDELHPVDETTDILKQTVGVCLIRSELGPDGVEQTVYRELSTRRYLHRGSMPLPASVAWYLSPSRRAAMHDHEVRFRNLMLEHIEREHAASRGLVVEYTV